MRKALVDSDGLVLNTIVIKDDANWSPPDGCTLVDAQSGGSIGDTWDGKRFVGTTADIPRKKSRKADWARKKK